VGSLQTSPNRALLRVISPAELDAQDQARAAANAPADNTQIDTGLSGYIRTQWQTFKMHRDRAVGGWSNRLLDALRVFNGTYDPTQLADIQKFGGSQVYARIIAMKCRGASALLRDVYLSGERPWALRPANDPDLPPEVVQSVSQLVSVESQTLAQAGQSPDAAAMRDRVMQLMDAARTAAKKRASKQADIAEDKVDEILTQGGFYKALAEFIIDLPLFPFACIKGPVVRIVPTVDWSQGKATIVNKPRLFWTRISPFDLWWTSGASDIDDAAVIERTRVSRSDLNDLLDLPGYNVDAIREILDLYGRGGLNDNWDMTDAERANQENRENPQYNQSGLISCLEFHGNVQGRILLEHGFTEEEVPDELRDYFVQAWMIDRWIIKVQLSPSPRKRHPYYITSFEKVPGTPVGNGLPDILHDIQEVANAALRSLVNNLSISSGPQVVVNDDRLTPDEDGEELYPWKRWHVTSDPMGSSSAAKPIDFFQPQSNAQELLGVYEKFSQIADEISAIPRFVNGNSAGGGAGRTASGLAMLMGNASKILQTVAANIDRDVLDPALSGLFDMIMLTDESGMLTGEEQIRVMGVNVTIQRETQRSRQLEFLQTTANPIDSQIVGVKGRGVLLRAISQTLGLPGEEIVPSDAELEALTKQAQAAQMQQAGAQAQGGQQSSPVNGDMGPRQNSQQKTPGIRGGP